MRARPAPPDDLRVETFQVGAHRYAICSYGELAPRYPFELSEAEWLVALLVLAGHSNVQVAEMRGVSARTIANQINAVYRKLGVHGRRELAAAWTSRMSALPPSP